MTALTRAVILILIVVVLAGAIWAFDVRDLFNLPPPPDAEYSVEYYHIEADEDIGNAVIDSGGTLLGLGFIYGPTKLSPADIRLVPDTIVIEYPGLAMRRSLERDSWQLGIRGFNDQLRLLVGPISIPPDYNDPVELHFVMRVFDKCADTLIYRRKIDLRLTR